MLWAKALHLIAMVCWFAALFYLPRLFVYHCMTEDEAGKARFKLMERKLLRGIATPSMLATLIFGVWLASYAWPYYLSSTWFWIKMALVLLLVVYHHVCAYHYRRLRDELNTRSHVYFRWFNELPVLILVGVIFLAVFKQP